MSAKRSRQGAGQEEQTRRKVSISHRHRRTHRHTQTYATRRHTRGHTLPPSQLVSLSHTVSNSHTQASDAAHILVHVFNIPSSIFTKPSKNIQTPCLSSQNFRISLKPRFHSSTKKIRTGAKTQQHPATHLRIILVLGICESHVCGVVYYTRILYLYDLLWRLEQLYSQILTDTQVAFTRVQRSAQMQPASRSDAWHLHQ